MPNPSRSSRGRKSSTVSFDGSSKISRSGKGIEKKRVEIVTPLEGRQASASSSISTASTWSIGAQPAASITALRNRILITLEKSLQLMSSYETKYLSEIDDDFQGVYQEFVKQMLTRIGYKTDLSSIEQLNSVIIKKFESEPSIAKRMDFKALKQACERAKAYQEMKSQVQMRLDEVFMYADSVCTTFEHETEGHSFESVENYEIRKTECLCQIRINFEAAHTAHEDLLDVHPVSNYLDHYNKVVHFIQHVTQCLRAVAVNLKKWVIADEQFEKEIEKEIMFLKQKASHMSQDHLSASSLRYDIKAKVPNANGMVRNVETNINRCESILGKLREKQSTVGMELEDVKQDLRKARRELFNIERATLKRQSPEEIAKLAACGDQIKEKITELQSVEDRLTSELSETKQDLAKMTKEFHTLENEKLRRKRMSKRTRQQVSEQKSVLRDQVHLSTTLKQKVRVLQKLLSMKRNPVTLRKIQFRMINIDYKGLNAIAELDDFCLETELYFHRQVLDKQTHAEAMQCTISQVAPRVGPNWPGIYVKLPFMPPRSMEQLNEDVKMVMRNGSISHKTSSEMAFAAFERWAKRSVTATINELVYAARDFIEISEKRELTRKVKFNLTRPKKRFHQLKAKSNVIYV